MIKEIIRQNFTLIAAILALLNSNVAKADSSPPYSQQGFINHVNTTPWNRSNNLFQHIDPRAPMECYELKPLVGTWGGLTKGLDDIWFSETKGKYVGLWGYGCFFHGSTTFTIGKKRGETDWYLNICDTRRIYWNSATKKYTYNAYAKQKKRLSI